MSAQLLANTPLTGATTPYTYANTNKIVRLNQIKVTLTCDGCSTETTLGLDFNELTLGLDGIDTGIKLNGLAHTGLNTITVAGQPNNRDQILAALKTDGQLVGTIIDANPNDNI